MPSPVVLTIRLWCSAIFGSEELAAQRFEAFERAFLVRPHQPRIPRDIGGEDRSEAASSAHSGNPASRIAARDSSIND
jgi:hypothetical protein